MTDAPEIDDGALDQVQRDMLSLADFAYQRLDRRLAGLTDDEYLWKPAEGCWSVRPVGDGRFRADARPPNAPLPDPPPLTTIAWRMCHIIDLLAADRNATWVGLSPAGELVRDGDPGTAAEAISQLGRAYALFRRHVAATGAGELTAPIGPVAGYYAESSRLAFVLHQLDELIHHAAEVATLRDLYRATRAARPARSTMPA